MINYNSVAFATLDAVVIIHSVVLPIIAQCIFYQIHALLTKFWPTVYNNTETERMYSLQNRSTRWARSYTHRYNNGILCTGSKCYIGVHLQRSKTVHTRKVPMFINRFNQCYRFLYEQLNRLGNTCFGAVRTTCTDLSVHTQNGGIQHGSLHRIN